jgi:hypothetical protein
VSWRNTGDVHPRSNRLDLETTGVGAVTIDLAGAKLKLCGLQIALRTDGPLQIKLISASPKKTKLVSVTKKSVTIQTVGC